MQRRTRKAAHPPGDESGRVEEKRSSLILRFRRSERALHWALAVPFTVCLLTAAFLVVLYNPTPERPYRLVFSWIHRIGGVCLIVFPTLALTKHRGDARVHLRNIGQAWRWTLADLKWLALIGLSAVNKRITLPEQGKFNAGEKLNFMTVMTTYPIFIITGVLLWLPGADVLAWVVHFGFALAVTPLIIGHIYMAVVNPGTRQGLSGMTTGNVDRDWARHHYAKWYAENFADDLVQPENPTDPERVPVPAWIPRQVKILCPSCRAYLTTDRAWLARAVLETKAIVCTSCGIKMDEISVVGDSAELGSLVAHLDRIGVERPSMSPTPGYSMLG